MAVHEIEASETQKQYEKHDNDNDSVVLLICLLIFNCFRKSK